MAISFERFLTLTAALAAASASMAGCGGDDDATATPSGGTSAGKMSAGGTSAGKAGAGRGGQSTGGSGARGGGAGNGTGGSGGTSTAGEGGEESGGAGAGGQSTGGSATGGISGSESNGGENSAGAGASQGGVSNGGAGGEPSGAGAGGADEGPCFGDVGAADCSSLSAGDLPSDECVTGRNPAERSCVYSESWLRPGVLDGLGSCLVPITNPCTIGAADATDACERTALRRACPNTAAADACAHGIDLGGGDVLASPTAACNDGTLTQASCTTALSAVTPEALENIVACADPNGTYGDLFAGTCAERMQFCVFPHASIYP